jgi:beta-lactamase class C
MKVTSLAILVAACLSVAMGAHAADVGNRKDLERTVGEVMRSTMAENDIPGMAVALSVEGKRYFFYDGLASRESRGAVTKDTIFEIGSISKTFTATLASHAQIQGRLSLTDKASKYFPALVGSVFDRISLLDLATFTAGGLPLQFPDSVTDDGDMINFFRRWRPDFPEGTHRLYSNPSIGLFGYLAARSMGASFDDVMEKQILPALGLNHTFITVRKAQMANYALGYTKDDKPIRVAPGVFDSEAYGVKSTAEDMLGFIEANLDGRNLESSLRGAVLATHTGYYDVGAMTQGLGWEMVRYPTTLDRLLVANSSEMAFSPHEATALVPHAAPRPDTLINKTGSTNGFGAYVVLVPGKKIGIVILANKNFPIPARVRAAYAILRALDGE